MAGTCKARVPMAEQIRLISECRQRGMIDADWCRENDIAASTFYNGVSRCRKAVTDQIQAANYGHLEIPRPKQDVVPVDIVPDYIPEQQNLFSEAEMEQDLSLLEEETVIREHTRKKKATHDELFKGLKVEKVVISLPEEDRICLVCDTQIVLIGEEYVRREREFIPVTCKVIEHYGQSYGGLSCREGLGDTEKPVIVKSQVLADLVGKGPASASAVAWTMYQKYANGFLLYRQEKD